MIHRAAFGHPEPAGTLGSIHLALPELPAKIRQTRWASGFIRFEEESKDDGRTWTPVLYLTRTSTVDGKEYEIRYKKQ